MRKARRCESYQIGQAIQFLPEQAGAIPPSCDLAVEKIEHEAGKGECQRLPEVILVVREEVSGGGEDRHAPAEAVHNRNQIREPEVPAGVEFGLGWVVKGLVK